MGIKGKPEYDGRVVDVERVYDDGITDYFAVVVKEDLSGFEFVGIGYEGAEVDAPEAVIGGYKAKQLAEKELARAQQKANYARASLEQALLDLKRPQKGKLVKVVKGRKIPKGTVAEVMWFGQGREFYGRAPYRVDLLVNGERVYTDAKNVEVVNPFQGHLLLSKREDRNA